MTQDKEISCSLCRESQIVARKPRDVMLALKTLSSPLEIRDLTAEAIFGSVIKRPKNINFLRSNSASMEFKPESLSRNGLGEKTET